MRHLLYKGDQIPAILLGRRKAVLNLNRRAHQGHIVHIRNLA